MLGGGLRSRAKVRWLGAAGLLLACLVALPGQAGADDPLPTISVNDVVTKPEGQTLDFKFTLSAAAAADVTVTAATSGGSGYTARNETVTIPAGQTSANFDMRRRGTISTSPIDNHRHPLRPIGQRDDRRRDRGRHDHRRDATPTIAISGPPPIAEGAVTAAYTVTMTGKSASGITVNYATANGSATAGPNADYDAKSGQLTWVAGETGARSSTSRFVRTRSTRTTRASRSISRAAAGATITTGTATTTITDDDAAASVGTVSDATVTEGNANTVDARSPSRSPRPAGRRSRYRTRRRRIQLRRERTTSSTVRQLRLRAGRRSVRRSSFKVKGDTFFEQDEKSRSCSPIRSTVRPDPTCGARSRSPTTSRRRSDPDEPVGPRGQLGLTDLVFEVTLAAPTRRDVQLPHRRRTPANVAADFERSADQGLPGQLRRRRRRRCRSRSRSRGTCSTKSTRR